MKDLPEPSGTNDKGKAKKDEDEDGNGKFQTPSKTVNVIFSGILAHGGFNQVSVTIDKFTKWIEVKLITYPKADRVLEFLDEIINCYGFPNRIIIDLGSNFNNHKFLEYYENSGIDIRYLFVAHPWANGQVERTNEMLLEALKKRLHDIANTKGGM
nr:uncharacterized protein LOC117849166 [Setaria viridis]